MSKIENRFKSMMLITMGINVLTIIVGILFFTYASFSVKINTVIMGALILVNGLFLIIKYLYDGLGVKIFNVDLIFGVISSILGIFSIFNPFKLLNVIGIFFGIWLFIVGTEKIYYAYKFMKKQEEIYPIVSFIALLLIVMGILVIFNPFETFMLITRLIGLFMICSSLFEILVCRLFIKRAINILDIFNN